MAQKDDTDFSDTDFDAEHQSSKKDPNIGKGEITESSNKTAESTEMADADISNSDFDSTHRSSTEIDYSDFKSDHNADEKKPKRIEEVVAPTVSPSEMNEIIQETDEFLDLCLNKVLSQEKAFTSMVYRLYNMNSDINVYKKLVDQQLRFVVNYSPTFDKYFKNLCEAVPLYGNFNVAFHTQDTDWGKDLPKYVAEVMIRRVLGNSYGGGMTLRSQNLIVRDVNHWIPARLSTIYMYESKQPLTLKLMESSIIQLKKLVDKITQLKAQLHYLMMDETQRPVADYSMLFS